MKMKYFLAIMFVLCAFWAIDILPVWGETLSQSITLVGCGRSLF